LKTSPAEQRVAWVTGASGGLGCALTETLLEKGWRVTASYHRENIHPASEKLHLVQLDVTRSDDVTRVSEEVLAHWGRLDVLINNAGIIADGPLWNLSEEEWDRAMSVNLKGAWHCAKAAAKSMIVQSSGHIVQIASFAARSGPAGQSNYAAAKAGLIGMTQSLAQELGPHQIQVNAILPGVLETQMTRDLSPARLGKLIADNTLKRLNTTREVAEFICFLVGMRNVSGQVFQLDSRISRWT
jgi:3-oxoacyl-[acyl-carrier protein] reductase